eukprot:3864274-Rhodomonas_salina.1
MQPVHRDVHAAQINCIRALGLRISTAFRVQYTSTLPRSIALDRRPVQGLGFRTRYRVWSSVINRIVVHAGPEKWGKAFDSAAHLRRPWQEASTEAADIWYKTQRAELIAINLISGANWTENVLTPRTKHNVQRKVQYTLCPVDCARRLCWHRTACCSVVTRFLWICDMLCVDL